LVLPLVEAVDGDDAAPTGQGALPALLLPDGLVFEINHPVGPAGVLGPGGPQAPLELAELPGAVGRGRHDQDVAGRGHVPAWLVALDPKGLGPDRFGQERELAGGADPSAHAPTLPDRPDRGAAGRGSVEQLLAQPGV